MESDPTCADDQDLIAGEAVGEVAIGFRFHEAALSRCQLVILQRHRWTGSRDEAVCTRTQLRLEAPNPWCSSGAASAKTVEGLG